MIVYLFHDSINGDFQIKTIFEDWKTFIGALGGLVFFGTIAGVILDSIHHTIVEPMIDRSKLKLFKVKVKERVEEIKTKEDEVFKDLKGNHVTYFYFVGFLPLERFQYLTDHYYCYVECEFNLFLSFLFSSFIYSYFIFECGCSLLAAIIVFFALIICSVYCLYAGTHNYLNFKKRRIDFIKGALEYNRKMSNSPPKEI